MDSIALLSGLGIGSVIGVLVKGVIDRRSTRESRNVEAYAEAYPVIDRSIDRMQAALARVDEHIDRAVGRYVKPSEQPWAETYEEVATALRELKENSEEHRLDVSRPVASALADYLSLARVAWLLTDTVYTSVYYSAHESERNEWPLPAYVPTQDVDDRASLVWAESVGPKLIDLNRSGAAERVRTAMRADLGRG